MTSLKEKKEAKKAELIRLTDAFCEDYLDEEYQEVIHKLIHKLGRKRDVPFLTGRMNIWAAAIVHAAGTINFLFDKSSSLSLSPNDVYAYFDTKSATVSQKSKSIRDMLKLSYFDEDFSIPSVRQAAPRFRTVNGFLVPEDPDITIVGEGDALIATIIGAPKLRAGQHIEIDLLLDQLEVTTERLDRFFVFLEDTLSFPFDASFGQPIDDERYAIYDATFHDLDYDRGIDPEHGICIIGTHNGSRFTMPVIHVILEDEENINFLPLTLYTHWYVNF